MSADELRERILELVAEYHDAQFGGNGFVPGESPVPVSGRVFDADELLNLVDSSLDFWLTTGRYASRFEKEFARFIGARHAMLCNSGSSANLLAIAALTSQEAGRAAPPAGRRGHHRRRGIPDDGQPDRPQPARARVRRRRARDVQRRRVAARGGASGRGLARSSLRTRSATPSTSIAVLALAKEHDLWLVEDNCDALGSTYHGRLTGTFGDLGTVSFYPAHHITMGEGGCVLTNRPLLKTLVESFRDWGRDCWCEPGEDNTCGTRFDWQLGDAPAWLRPQVHLSATSATT